MKTGTLIVVLAILLLLTSLALMWSANAGQRAGEAANIKASETSGYVWKVKRVINKNNLLVVDQFNSTFVLTISDTHYFKTGDTLNLKKTDNGNSTR
jgi:hypothetical protein